MSHRVRPLIHFLLPNSQPCPPLTWQVGWRNCSPTGAGWAATPHTDCIAREAGGAAASVRVDKCVGPIAFAKGPLEVISRVALEWVVASPAFQRDTKQIHAVEQGKPLPRANDPASGDLYHDVQLGLWLSAHPSLRIVALPMGEVWADEWRHLRRLDRLLMAHRVPFDFEPWLTEQTERIWAASPGALVRSACLGAPCKSEHCAQAAGQQVCVEEVVVARPVSGGAALAGCSGCQCWHRNSSAAPKVWTSANCKFRKREQPKLPALCWVASEPTTGSQPIHAAAVAPTAFPAPLFSDAASCEPDHPTPRAWGVDAPEPLAACVSAMPRTPSDDAGRGSRLRRRMRKMLRRPHAAPKGGITSLPYKQGFCGETTDGEQGDCYAGDFGMWRVNSPGSVRQDGIGSLEECVARCRCCLRCNYVSFSASPAHLDCSWYHACPTKLHEPPPTGRDYVTVAVERSEVERRSLEQPWEERASCASRRAKLNRRYRLPPSSDCVGITNVCAVGGRLLLQSDPGRGLARRLSRRFHSTFAEVAPHATPEAPARLAQRGSIASTAAPPARYCPLSATLVGDPLLPPNEVSCLSMEGDDRWRTLPLPAALSQGPWVDAGVFWWPAVSGRRPHSLLDVFGQAWPLESFPVVTLCCRVACSVASRVACYPACSVWRALGGALIMRGCCWLCAGGGSSRAETRWNHSDPRDAAPRFSGAPGMALKSEV